METQSTLTCNVTSDLMILYTTGKASEETRHSIESHLQTCAACAQAFGRELHARKRNRLPKASYTELDNFLERLKYVLLPILGFVLFLLTKLLALLDHLLRRLGLSTTHLKIRLYRARRKLAGQLTNHEPRESEIVAA